MARSIHVRLDAAADDALRLLRAGGLPDSETVRMALRETAARRRMRASLAAEVAALAADGDDRAEARRVRELMAQLAPEPAD
jgi:hypothetical protein